MKDGILRPSGADMDEIKEGQKAAARRIEDYFADAVKDRRAHPRDDILSLFIEAEVDSERLTEDEILGICFLFILAGLDTVTDSLECFIARLAQHPGERRQIVDDPAIIPSAVEELLRWETPVTTVARVATRDVELGGARSTPATMSGSSSARPTPTTRRSPAPTRWIWPAARTGTWRSAAVSTVASDPTWPGSNCASPSASGTGASLSTRSSRAPSSAT